MDNQSRKAVRRHKEKSRKRTVMAQRLSSGEKWYKEARAFMVGINRSR